MPIYEYRCQSCDHHMEALQKMSDAPLSDCPECHKPTLKKKISAAGFRLSGSGWYETDFKSGDKKNLAGDKESSTDKVGAKKDSAKPKDGKTSAGENKSTNSSSKAASS